MKEAEEPRISVVIEKEEGMPPPPESFLERRISEYLKTAPEDQQRALSDPRARAEVLKELAEIETLMPFLERMNETTGLEARNLGITEATSLKDAFLDKQISSACKLVALEKNSRLLRDENAVLAGAIEDLREDNEGLKAQARIDALTEMPNRRAYEEEAERFMELSRRTGVPLWCMMLDIDDFRHVNNDHGHQAGDQVLREVARRLQTETRKSDFIARFGGEEFVALIHGDTEDDKAGARVAAQRMLEAIGSEPFVVRTSKGVKTLRVTMSIGGTRLIVQEDEKDTMEDRADQSLYAAKHAGKNQVFLEGRYVEKINTEGIPEVVVDKRASILPTHGNLAIAGNS